MATLAKGIEMCGRFPKALFWLLAAMLTVQPVSGTACDCNKRNTDAGNRPANHGCCCGEFRCCATSSRPVRTCCKRNTHTDDLSPNAGACTCESSAPSAPASIPTRRSQTVEVAMPTVCTHVLAVEAPQIPQESWAADSAVTFASASEHCIALCRLRF